jgi:tyrosyl-tRNA synthetase
MLMQSYDFLYQFDHYGCVMQTGGSDQWGNITAGAELIRRMRGQSAYGMVYPLITKADGTKFGKTESGAVWLSADRTSPYQFYQFWMNTDDRDVINYLKVFTFQTQEQVQALAQAVIDQPEKREAQRVLAREMTATMHGETALARAEAASQVLFGGEVAGLSAAEIAEIFADVPSSELPKTQFEGEGMPLVDLLVTTGLAKSKGDARRSLSDGGMYLNNRRAAEQNVTLQDVVDGKFIVLRKGRKNYALVKVLA